MKGDFAFKGFRGVIKFIDFLRRVNPCFRLEHVDVVFAVHHIQIRTAEVFNQLSIFVVRVEDIYFLPAMMTFVMMSFIK